MERKRNFNGFGSYKEIILCHRVFPISLTLSDLLLYPRYYKTCRWIFLTRRTCRSIHQWTMGLGLWWSIRNQRCIRGLSPTRIPFGNLRTWIGKIWPRFGSNLTWWFRVRRKRRVFAGKLIIFTYKSKQGSLDLTFKSKQLWGFTLYTIYGRHIKDNSHSIKSGRRRHTAIDTFKRFLWTWNIRYFTSTLVVTLHICVLCVQLIKWA